MGNCDYVISSAKKQVLLHKENPLMGDFLKATLPLPSLASSPPCVRLFLLP
jgi:hypothetical protein